jgi:hypothetical protein
MWARQPVGCHAKEGLLAQQLLRTRRLELNLAEAVDQ